MRVETGMIVVAGVHEGNAAAAPRRLRRSTLNLALSAGFAAAASMAPSAHAQSAPAAPSTAASAAAPKKGEEQQLQTVVVTAEKKVSSEQKTAISMSEIGRAHV